VDNPYLIWFALSGQTRAVEIEAATRTARLGSGPLVMPPVSLHTAPV